eukprot:TRINITY_DN10536_c0_g1_i1.p1 TRINITY_DN10536_c0_g1~~TRINITY_DN10536_c0_g1_i1.p1  ORF type:complete len:276 (+),score=60.72 TRINITY_DN10536_c0_g1_i1:295-1122(+)
MGRPKRQALAPLNENAAGHSKGGTLQETGACEKGSLSEAQAAVIVNEINEGVEKRIEVLRSCMEERIARLQQELQVQLSKLPQCVLDMPVLEFQSQYGGSVEAVLRAEPRAALEEAACEASRGESEGNESGAGAAASTATRGAVGDMGDSHEEATSKGDDSKSTRRGRRGAAVSGSSAGQAHAITGGAPLSVGASGRGRQTRSRAAAAFDTPTLVTPNGCFIRSSSEGGLTGGQLAATARMPRPGELLLSVNGSPLGLFQQSGLVTPLPEILPKM